MSDTKWLIRRLGGGITASRNTESEAFALAQKLNTEQNVNEYYIEEYSSKNGWFKP